jgi:VIT1/CCC1 family predicted Fe2+/Mn2+ transporter
MIYNLKKFARAGVGFGITSGVITTLGVIIGLQSGTQSASIIIGGIITIAIADAFSDALGIHTSEEAEGDSDIQIWVATLTAFLAKFITTASFAIPFLILDLTTSVYASVIWGAILLAVFSFVMARSENKSPYLIVSEHILIAAVVVAITHLTGKYIGSRLI